MATVRGHDTLRKKLENYLPAVTLLTGPESTGKFTLAEYIAEYHGIDDVDTLKIKRLTADIARTIPDFISLQPLSSSYRCVLIKLDGARYAPAARASDEAVSSLLKTLEEPPSTVKFLLTASFSVSPTLKSRSTVFPCGYLTKYEVEIILSEKLMFSPRDAHKAAQISEGTIQGALMYYTLDHSKPKVLSVLRAIADNDHELLIAATSGESPHGRSSWAHDEHKLLFRWIREALTERWVIFSPEESFSVNKDKKLVRMLLLRLGKVPMARPKLAVRYAAEPLVKKR